MTTATAVDWRTRALCRANPELWTTRNVAKVREALHICRRHCPVLFSCRRHAGELLPFYRADVVLGGVSHGSEGRPTTRQTAAKKCGSCRAEDRSRREEDEGLTVAEMDAERDLDEAERDEREGF